MEQNNFGIIGVTDEGYPIVAHTNSCGLWVGQSPGGLCPTRECWYCKYADFRKTTAITMQTSICRHPGNKMPIEKDCKNEDLHGAKKT
ncbi:MAG: hypothetical protein RSC52_05205 [Oscillospiraceae bacterium]